MVFKKINAVLALSSIAFMLIHLGYNIFAYLTFYYNPFLSKLTAVPVMVAVCLHGVLGMLIVFTRREGSAADMYPGLNRRTVLQRISAALIFPLLIVHINTFAWMRACREKGYFILVGLLIMAQIGFFAAVITHVSVSFTNAFVTLGFLSSPEKKAVIDRVVYVIGAVLFLASVGVVVNGQIRMILMG